MDKKLDFIINQAKKNLEKDGSVSAAAFIEGIKDGKEGMFIVPLFMDENRGRMFHALGKAIYKVGIEVKVISLLTECYYLGNLKDNVKEDEKTNKDEINKETEEKIKEAYEKYGSLSKHPDAKEALIVAQWDVKNKKKVIMLPFSKDKDNKFVFEKKKEMNSEKKEQEAQLNILENFWNGYLIYGGMVTGFKR